LDGSNTGTELPRELANVKGLIGAAVKQSQNVAPRLTEQDLSQECGIRSHIENKCTQSENNLEAETR
jgi:hypothetical protein